MGELFWTGHIVRDVTYILIFAQFVLFSIIIWRIPGILMNTIDLIFKRREDELYAYIQRYMPWPVFRLIIHFQTAIGVSLGCWLLLMNYKVLPPAIAVKDLLIPLILFAAVVAFEVLRRGSYRLLIWLFSPSISYDDWRNYSSVAEWLWSMFLPVISLLALAPVSPSIALFLMISLFVLFRMSLIIKSIKLCCSTKANPLQVFLYLCTHEILPYLYLFIAAIGGLLYL